MRRADHELESELDGLPARLPFSGCLALALGESTLAEVILKCGSPTSVYLVGAEEEVPHPRLTDDIAFTFRIDIELGADSYLCPVTVVLDNNTGRVVEILVNLQDPSTTRSWNVRADSVTATFGEPQVRLRLRLPEGELGGEPLPPPCVHSTGEVERWVYASMGLQVYIESFDDQQVATTLRFSLDNKGNSKPFPDCLAGGTSPP